MFLGTQPLNHVWLFCNPIDSSQPGSSVHEISQARILEWDAISFFRGSFQHGDWTHVSCIGRQVLYHWATREALPLVTLGRKRYSLASYLNIADSLRNSIWSIIMVPAQSLGLYFIVEVSGCSEFLFLGHFLGIRTFMVFLLFSWVFLNGEGIEILFIILTSNMQFCCISWGCFLFSAWLKRTISKTQTLMPFVMEFLL